MDRITTIGYWYHDCPKTKQTHRIGFNYKIVKANGRCPAYEKCFRCGQPRPEKKS